MRKLTHTHLLLWTMSLMIFPLIGLGEFNHNEWNRLLKEHVVSIRGGQVTQVDYDGFLRSREDLRNYLADLSRVDRPQFNAWGKSEQLAFLINAYNAWTVEVVLTRYPQLESIRDIGLFPSSVWRKNIVKLFGDKHSLDDIEHKMIRGSGLYEEPRIHFALNCAAIGCPALRVEAYVGVHLDRQLEEDTELFLIDRSRNYFLNGKLYISPIFDWYREDFENGWSGIKSVSQFLSSYRKQLGLNPEAYLDLQRDNIPLKFLEYDWSLNRIVAD